MTVSCSVARWPMLMLELSGLSDRAHSEAMLEILSRRIAISRCAVVIDTRLAELAGQATVIENLQREARWLRENEPLIERNVVGFALVVDNVAVRFLFSSLLSMATLKTTWLATTRRDEAERFCERALLRARISVPPPARSNSSSFPPPPVP